MAATVAAAAAAVAVAAAAFAGIFWLVCRITARARNRFVDCWWFSFHWSDPLADYFICGYTKSKFLDKICYFPTRLVRRGIKNCKIPPCRKKIHTLSCTWKVRICMNRKKWLELGYIHNWHGGGTKFWEAWWGSTLGDVIYRLSLKGA